MNRIGEVLNGYVRLGEGTQGREAGLEVDLVRGAQKREALVAPDTSRDVVELDETTGKRADIANRIVAAAESDAVVDALRRVTVGDAEGKTSTRGIAALARTVPRFRRASG